MKITMYELLGLIKDGKAPKKIMYLCDIYELHIINEYTYYKNGTTPLLISTNSINDTVEILEEEKKIPEKLEQIMSKRGKYNSINDLAEEVFKAFETIDDLIINQNQLIDYLKNKGE